jgi:hypothetical protein
MGMVCWLLIVCGLHRDGNQLSLRRAKFIHGLALDEHGASRWSLTAKRWKMMVWWRISGDFGSFCGCCYSQR